MVELEDVLHNWREGYGGRIPKKPNDRKQAFLQLFVDLEANGYNREQIVNLVKTNRSLIESFCYNINHKKSKKLAIWKAMVRDDLKAALVLYSPLPRGTVTDDTVKMQKMEADESEQTPSISDDPIEEESPILNAQELNRDIFKDFPEPPPTEEEALLKELGGNDNE